MLTKEILQKRRNELKTLQEADLILLPSNMDSPMNCKDNCYPFIQDATFQYYFGMNHPNLIGVIDVKEKKEYVFGKDFSMSDIIWMGKIKFLKEEAEDLGLEFRDLEELPKWIENRKVAITNYYRADTVFYMAKLLGKDPYRLGEHISEELISKIIEQRNQKSNEELEELEKAVNVTREMHLEAMRVTRVGMKEYEVVAALEAVAAKHQCSLSFPTIFSKNGQILHNHRHDNVLQEGDLVILDAGAKLPSGYCGDMTTTFPVSKKYSDRQRKIYNIVIHMFERAEELCRPGITYREVHLEVCKVMVEELKELDFFRGEVENIVIAGAHALFMPHGLGHMLGLDVHDMENFGEEKVGYAEFPKSSQFGLASLRLGRELEEGFVYTIEPGIYFIPELFDLWKKERKFEEFLNYDVIESYMDFGGIRYEGDFVITKDSCRRLGEKMLKYPEEIEEYRKKFS
ncbi:peptidase, M24 family [Fusobacterium gonidiaformans 3-1-5R]|uniref:Xaa-Pro aminopeptidase n=2 Tax=Fusobacterium TaxID=848 RepID=E5BDN8_9FUSO|nr:MULTISPECIES: aminopeptidase P family protein [Fusobacterium]EFS21164.1 peptidase, M24 family [Fusobacterium gonidiaformans 3-1-5R]KXA16787.1 peptidase, M24 family [Fusobacterium equinum]